MRKILIGTTGAAAVAALVSFAPLHAAAADAAGGLAAASAVCKSKPESECGATEGCVWIAGYRVANGQQVPGYCRPAPKDLTAKRGSQAQPKQ